MVMKDTKQIINLDQVLNKDQSKSLMKSQRSGSHEGVNTLKNGVEPGNPLRKNDDADNMLTHSDQSQLSPGSEVVFAHNRSKGHKHKDKSTLLYMLKDFKLKYLLLNQGE